MAKIQVNKNNNNTQVSTDDTTTQIQIGSGTFWAFVAGFILVISLVVGFFYA
jgi:hypothetical protein